MGWDRQLIFGLPLFRDDGDFFVATNCGATGDLQYWCHGTLNLPLKPGQLKTLVFLVVKQFVGGGGGSNFFPALVRGLHRFAPSTREIGVEGPIIVLPGDTSASAFVSTNGIQAFFFMGKTW